MFNKEAFLKFVLEHEVVGFHEGGLHLKSGRISHWYCNWRTVTKEAKTLGTLCDHLLDYLEDQKIEYDCLFGVPEGATKTATIANYKRMERTGKTQSLPMGRANPKTHGDPKDRFFVGAPEGKVLVLEDVCTTGGSLLQTMDTLWSAGIEVVGALCLTHRQEKREDNQTVKDALEKEFQMPLYSMSVAQDILPLAIEKLKPSKAILQKIESAYKEYGEVKITFPFS